MFPNVESLKGCSLSSFNKCYGSLPPDGSTPSHLIEVIIFTNSKKNVQIRTVIFLYSYQNILFYSYYRKLETSRTYKLAKHFARICTVNPVHGSCLIVPLMNANCFLGPWKIYMPIAKKLDTPKIQITAHVTLSLNLIQPTDAT